MNKNVKTFLFIYFVHSFVHLCDRRMGDGGRGHWLVWMEWRPAGWSVSSVNLPLHHEVQKFSSGTGSPGWSRKKGSKTAVVWWCGVSTIGKNLLNADTPSTCPRNVVNFGLL